MQRPWQGTSLWNRSRCTATAKVLLRQSMGQSAKLWAPVVPEHTSGAGFRLPTTRSGRSRSRVMRQRDVEAGRTSHLYKKGNDLADTLAKKSADTHKPAYRVAKTVVACASPAKQAARWAAEAHVLLRFRGWNDTQAAVQRARTRPPRARLKRKRRSEIAAPTSGQVCDWLSPHRSFTFFARQSPRSSHFQRALLAIGTSFRCWGPSIGQRHHLLRSVWSGLLGTCGRANFTAAHIEVRAVSQQTLPWLDS